MIVRQYRDLPEALLAKAALESAGIECYLTEDNVVRLDWFWSNAIGGVKLHVKPDDSEAAIAVLGQDVPDAFEVEGVGNYELPRCPQCKSADISLDELNKPLSYLTAYLGVPVPFYRSGWRCHACGRTWKDGAHA